MTENVAHSLDLDLEPISDDAVAGLDLCLSETRIGPSSFFGATRTEHLSYVSASSQRACGVSWPELTSDLFLFTQEDPIGLGRTSGYIPSTVGDPHLYAYVRSGPTMSTDPSGLQCTPTCPDCPTGNWFGVGVQITGQNGFLGGSGAHYWLWCPSGKMRCAFLTICGRVGYGAMLAFLGQGSWGINAKCASDLAGFSIGLEYDLGTPKGITVGGDASVSVPSFSAGQANLGGGFGFGSGGGLSGCYTIKGGCTKY